ncbi:DUF4747 family protein [Qipengyuania flava]|uniref:DUF4747 family protein n=1 Tax=Qipengyuania flava TaxID=192812 RepID=UPI003BB084F0
MARPPKIEVAAVNIRIPETHDRDYSALLGTLAELRRGVRVYGDSYLAISHFDPEQNVGVFSKYTEIDIDGEWFDLDDFDTAGPEKIDEINIPENLRPNHSQFYFKLSPELHVIAFSSYSSSKALSARSVERYFAEALRWTEVAERFGKVESDIVKSYGEVDRILELPELKQLHLIIRRPNSDDVGKSLADIIEERLREQNADQYEESLTATGSNDLDPNDRTKKLAHVAAENGQVHAKSIVNGVLVPQNTEESPLTEQTTYEADQGELPVFSGLAKTIFVKIEEARKALL